MEDLSIEGEFDPSILPERKLPKQHPLTFRKPLIAAINGAAAGVGLVQALLCDVRFAVPTAKFTTSFSRRGLIAEYGIAWLLPRVVGPSRAMDLLLSARVVTGDDAHRIGLIDHLVEPGELLDRAVEYAQDLATMCSPMSMGVIKSQVLSAIESDLPTAVARADAEMLASFYRQDVREGVDSFVDRRPPAFAPLEARDLEEAQ